MGQEWPDKALTMDVRAIVLPKTNICLTHLRTRLYCPNHVAEEAQSVTKPDHTDGAFGQGSKNPIRHVPCSLEQERELENWNVMQ